jgi:hypothetical protein
MNLQYGQYPYGVEHVPAGYCAPPTDLAASVNGDVVKLSWKAEHPVLYFKLEILKAEDNSVAFSGNVIGLRHTIQLPPHTEYRASLLAICSTDPARDSVVPLEIDFTTAHHIIVCLPVNISSVFHTLQAESVVLTWAAPADALGYSIFYKVKNSILSYDKVASQDNTVILRGLVYNTAYEYYIVTHCKAGAEAKSEVGEFKPPLDPAVCPPPRVRAILNNLSAVIVWEFASQHFGYDIYINGALHLGNYSSNILNLTLDPLTQYRVAVVGRCADGLSIAGTTDFNTAALACGVPQNLTIDYTEGAAEATAKWDAIESAQGYKVLVNGSLNEAGTAEYAFPVLPGTTYKVQVITICEGGESVPAEKTLTTPAGCATIIERDITSEVTAVTIKLDWPDTPGAQFYNWRYRFVGIDNEWLVPYKKTTNSELLIDGLVPNTAYEVEIETTCTAGIARTFKTLSTTGLETGTKPVITGFSKVTATGFCVNFTAGTKRMGRFTAKVRNTTTNVTTEHDGFTLSICVAGKEPHTIYEVIIEDRALGFTVVPSEPVQVTTCYLCAEVGALVAVFTENGDIAITWTAALGANSYNVYTRLGDGAWSIPVNVTTLAYTVTDNNYAYKTIRVESVYTDCNSSCSTTCLISCGKVGGMVHDINGSAGTFSWTAIPGSYGYKVEIRSLGQPIIERFVTDAFVMVTDFIADTTYGWVVIPYCTVDTIGVPSDALTFTTGADSPGETACSEAIVTAFMQDSVLSGPGDGETSFNGQDGFVATEGQTTYTDIRVVGMTSVAVWRGDAIQVRYSVTEQDPLIPGQVLVNLTTGVFTFGSDLYDKEYVYYQWFVS